ncbi:MAG TPA: hypothetical protein VJV75_09610, partial [Candidatus Polarisedimenticolia bacterium]|nr:hypothetical protein [Candidatus Polarisedimenticolia bacterium]
MPTTSDTPEPSTPPCRAARAGRTAALLLALAGVLAPSAVAQDAPPTAGATPPAAVSEATATDVEALRRRIAELEKQLAGLRDEMTKTGAPGGAALEARLAALESEIAALRDAAAPRPASGAPERRSVNGFDLGASRPFLVKRGLTMGGYGTGLYQKYTQHRDDDTDANLANQA